MSVLQAWYWREYLEAVDGLVRMSHGIGRGHPRKAELVLAIETLQRAHLRDLCLDPAMFDARLMHMMGLTQQYLAGLLQRMAQTAKASGTANPDRLIDAHGREIDALCWLCVRLRERIRSAPRRWLH